MKRKIFVLFVMFSLLFTLVSCPPEIDTPSEENVEPSAKEVDSFVVKGIVNQTITPVSIFIELSKGKFTTISNINVASWFKNGTVSGLTYMLSKNVQKGDTSLTIKIEGKPTEKSSVSVGNIVIPKENFVYATKDLTLELYEADRYDIQDEKATNGNMKLITVDGEKLQAVDYTNNTATVDLGDYEGDLYLVISNPTTSTLSSPSVSGFTQTTTKNPYVIKSNIKSFNTFEGDDIGFKDKVMNYIPEIKIDTDVDSSSKTKARVVTNDFVSPYKNKKVGDAVSLFVSDEDGFVQKVATIREKRTVNTAFGDKTLIIAVENSMWNTELKDSELSTSAKIDDAFIKQQADAFLKAGDNNDIYDYVTQIYGEEWDWNDSMDVDYISDTNEILILFAQIDGQTSGRGATAGYFYSVNNYQNGDVTNKSNQAICLIMDAYYNAYNPTSSLTTMAHEFQHAVHYYQRVAKKGLKYYEYSLPGSSIVQQTLANKSISSDTWVNEMFASLSEDAVAAFIGVDGPGYNSVEMGGPMYDDPTMRLAYNGRLPQYFRAQRYTLTDWYGTSEVNALHPYGLVYSFGSYLIRNYGVDVIKNYMASDALEYPNTRIVYNNSTRELNWDTGESNAYNIVLDAVKKASGNSSLTWSDLIRGWGASILLSEEYDAQKPYKLSRYDINGDYFWWTEPYKEYGLKIPSLDYFRYASISGQMWENGSSLITIGPYIFNQYTDRLYSNKDSAFRANTNTFLKLDENVSGVKTYTINGISGLEYTFVLKPIVE